MIRVGLTLLFLLAFAAAAPGGARAEGKLVHSTEYRQHRIVGATPTELWRYIIAHPIIDPDDGPAIANIIHDHKLSFKAATANGACRVTDLTFTWRFVITLPMADEGRMTAATRKMWREFIGYLKTHEEHHRAIFVGCGQKFVPAAAGLKGLPGCLGMNGKVKRYVDKQYDACMKKQRAFDHEETQATGDLALVKAAKAAKLPAGSGF